MKPRESVASTPPSASTQGSASVRSSNTHVLPAQGSIHLTGEVRYGGTEQIASGKGVGGTGHSPSANPRDESSRRMSSARRGSELSVTGAKRDLAQGAHDGGRSRQNSVSSAAGAAQQGHLVPGGQGYGWPGQFGQYMAYQPYQQGPNRYAPSYYHHQNYPGMHTPSAYYGHQAAMVYDPQAGQAQPALDTSPTHSFPGAGMPSSAMTSPTYLGSQYPPTYQAYQPYYPTPGAGTTVTGPHSNAHAHHAGPRQLPPGQPALGAAAQGSEMQPSPSQSATPTARSSPSLGQAEAASENGSHYSPYTSPYQPYSSFNFYSPSTSSPVPAPASLQGLPQQQYAMGTSYPTPNQPGVQYETFGTAPSAHPQPLGANQRQAPNVHGPAVYSSYMLPWRPPPVPGYGYGQVNTPIRPVQGSHAASAQSRARGSIDASHDPTLSAGRPPMPGPGSAILDLPARPPPVVAARPVPPVQPYPLTGQPGLPSGPASASGAGVYARPPGRETTAQGPADQVRTSTGTVLPLARGATVSQLLGGTTAPSSTAPNQSRAQGRGGTRSHYHPQQGPRSDYVMWCGNVPADATVEELWEIFSKLPPESDEVDFQLGSDAGSTSDKVVGEREGNVDNALDPATGASGHGVMSIFTISRSNCAFVNYATRKHLERAVRYFYGKPVRPNDPRCPKLVCRVRKKDDEAQAGVAGQRGRGMHVTWLKEHERKRKAAAQVISPSPVDIDRGTSTGSTTPRPAVSVTSPGSAAALAESGHLPSGLPATSGSETPTDKLLAPPDRPPISHVASSSSLGNESSSNQESSSGSLSYSSTNSSLFRHPAFRNRYFILKSLTDEELEQSVRTGLWATQPHNEPVLDQAFRNSENVILIFSANQSGEFFGYARMASPIKTDKSGEVAEQHRTGGGRPTTIVEVEDENGNDRVTHPILSPGSLPPHQVDGSTMIFSPSASMGPTSSPQPITPLNETLTTSTDDNNKKISDDSDKTVVPRPQPTSWPLTSTDRGDAAVGREKRGTTLSPKLLQSVPGPLRPELNAGPSTIEPKPSEASLVSQMSNMAVNREPTPRAEPDEFGVRRKDMASESSTPVTHATSPGDTGSLGPSDSASWGDARSEREAAVKAVIHNLRLEERESVRKVEQLEAQLQVSRMGANLASDTSGSDSWGTPFKVEWLHTRRLPFHAVRRLRNPWRDNRQVKVSRDGTELEPGVGAQLLQEWEKPAAEGNPGPRRRSDSSTLSKEGEEEDEEDGSDEG